MGNEQTRYDEATQRALDRVRKMLALANDAAASEGERDNALRMAHATLAKYNLSVADATAAPRDDRGDRTFQVYSPPWIRIIASAVARLFFCEHYYSTSRGAGRATRHHFIGREANAVTAMEMTAYLVKSIRNEAGRRKRELMATGRWEVSFINGAAEAVARRCREMREQAEAVGDASVSGGTAVVLASVYAVEKQRNLDWLEAAGVRVRNTQSRMGSKDAHGYLSGKAYGDTVNLSNQIGRGAGRGDQRKLK